MEVIRQTKNYNLTVQILPDDKLPQYVVTHNTYGVVEYADNTLLRAFQWMDECEKLTEKYMSEGSVKTDSGTIRTLN